VRGGEEVLEEVIVVGEGRKRRWGRVRVEGIRKEGGPILKIFAVQFDQWPV